MLTLKTRFQQSKQLLNDLKQDYNNRLAAEKELSQQLSALFLAAEKQILINLKSFDEIPADFYSIISPLDDLRVVYTPLIAQNNVEHFIRGYGRTATLIRLAKSELTPNVASKALKPKPSKNTTIIIDRGDDFFGIDETTLEYIENKQFVASQRVMDRVNTTISKNLSKSYNDGVGIDNAARNLRKEFNKLEGYEAKRIARTEINSAQNMGAFRAYADFDIQYHQWWSGQDNRVRDSHVQLHGQIVQVDQTFENGLMYPGDMNGSIEEWINCRCTTVPYLMPLGFMAPPGVSYFYESDIIPIPGFDQDKVFAILDDF